LNAGPTGSEPGSTASEHWRDRACVASSQLRRWTTNVGPPLTLHNRILGIRAADVGGSAMIRRSEDGRGIPIGRGEQARHLVPGGELVGPPHARYFLMLDGPNTVAGLMAEAPRTVGEDRESASPVS
jgi:hypothetical protein